MKQNRFKSKVVWVSILGALFLIYNTIANEIGLPVIEDGVINTIVNGVVGLLVTFGILNDPTNPEAF